MFPVVVGGFSKKIWGYRLSDYISKNHFVWHASLKGQHLQTLTFSQPTEFIFIKVLKGFGGQTTHIPSLPCPSSGPVLLCSQHLQTSLTLYLLELTGPIERREVFGIRKLGLTPGGYSAALGP